MAKNVVVYGAARSGTTLLMDYLNQSDQCFVLSESNILQSMEFAGFRRTLHLLKSKENAIPTKGVFLPAFVSDDTTGAQALEALGQHFEYVGEKIALGPDRRDLLSAVDDITSLGAQTICIVTLRDPTTNLVSMRKMFPGASDQALYFAWAWSVLSSLVLLLNLPKCYLVHHAELSAQYLGRLASKIGLSINVAEDAIGGPHIHTSALTTTSGKRSWWSSKLRADERNEIPAILANNTELFSKAQDLYSKIIESYDSDQFKLACASNSIEFMKELLVSAEDLVRLSGGRSFLGVAGTRTKLQYSRHEQEIDTRFALGDLSHSTFLLIESLIRLDQRSSAGYYYRAFYFQAINQPDCEDEILNNYKYALTLGHNPFWVKYNRAAFYFRIGRIKDALDDTAAVEALGPQTKEYAFLQQLASRVEGVRNQAN